jgi:hypothetical protein
MEGLLKEHASITLPNLAVPIGFVQATTLVELSTLLSLFYFWQYYREARRSGHFPAAGTLFGVFARTRFTRAVFVVLLCTPPASAAILASKSLWITPENAVVAVFIFVVAVMIRYVGPLPAVVHDD